MATTKNQHPNDPRNPLNRPEVPEDQKQQRLRDNVVKHNGTYDHLETFQNERTGQYTVIGRKPNNQTIILGSSNQPINLDELNKLAANSPKREAPSASSRGGKGTDQGKGDTQQKKGSGTGATKSKAKAKTAAPKAAAKVPAKRADAPKAQANRKAA